MRPPYSGLKSGHPNPLVCGRKFCSRCGRWRHACDFDWMKQNGRISRLRAWCRTCQRISNRESTARRTSQQKELIKEYQRFWREAERRKAGIQPRAFNYAETNKKRRKTRIDRIEQIFLELPPLLEKMNNHYQEYRADNDIRFNNERNSGFDAYFASITGMDERQIYRLRSGESKHVRIDTADRIAYAMGTPLGLVYIG